jgi:hypothetical protein
MKTISLGGLDVSRIGLGRQRDTGGVRLIRAMSVRGLIVGTARTAGLPALLAATWLDAEGGRLYGPSGF